MWPLGIVLWERGNRGFMDGWNRKTTRQCVRKYSLLGGGNKKDSLLPVCEVSQRHLFGHCVIWDAG